MKKKYVYKNINFDSDEEIAFYQWCEEAKELELITEFIYQPISYLLFKSDITYPRLTKKGNISNKVLLREHKYTPDYCIILTQLCRNLYFNIFKFPDENLKVYIDVKGDFTKSDREKRFILNQK